MNRSDAIQLIVGYFLPSLTLEAREEILLDWWSIDEDGKEFLTLPKCLKDEIKQYDFPQSNLANKMYDALIAEGLKYKYIGVKNRYLENIIFNQIEKETTVVGEEEKLNTCPCCNYRTLKNVGQYEICPVCFWEDDGSNELNLNSSVNHMSIQEARHNYSKYGAIDKNYLTIIEPGIKERYYKD